MTDNDIRVVITATAAQLREALAGAKGDLGGLTAAIKAVPDSIKIDVQAQTATAIARLHALEIAAGRVPTKINIVAQADTGIAQAKLDILQGKIRDTEREAARMELGLLAGRAVGGGGGGGAGILAAPLAAPIAGGVAAGLTGVIGSAGQGILGAGAIATAFAGAMTAGIVPLGLLSSGLTDAITLSGQLQTAQGNLATAVQLYGAKSTQAHTAQQALNVLLNQADPATLKLANSLTKANAALDKASAIMTPLIAQALKPMLATFTALLPTLTEMAKIDLGGIVTGLRPLLDMLRSSEFQGLLIQLARNFAQLAPLMFRGLTDLLLAFTRTAVAAGPAMLQMAGAFTGVLDKLAAFTASPAFGPFIAQVIGQFRTWMGLAEALGKLVWGILTAGSATGGQTLVATLTNLTVAITPALIIAFKGLTTVIQAIAALISTVTTPLPGVLKIVPALLVGAAVIKSWMLLKDAIAGTLGVAGTGAGAGGGADLLGVPAGAGGGLKSLLLKGGMIAGIGTLLSAEIGGAVKGGLGKAISDIGGGASVGGGIGLMLGVPWLGAAVGAALGGAIDVFTSRGKPEGEHWATEFVASLPGHVSDAVKRGLQQSATAPAPSKPLPAGPPVPTYGRGSTSTIPGTGASPAQYATELAKYVAVFGQQGKTAGDAFVKGVQGVRFPTPLLLSSDMITALNEVPKRVREAGPKAVLAWQDNAAQEMLAYAGSLVKNGKLPANAVNGMIHTLESFFPGLTAYLDKSGLDSAQAIATHLKLTDALANLKGAVGNMRSQWGDMAISSKLTNSNIYANTAQAMDDLRLLMHSKNEQIRDDAKAEYDRLRSETNTTFRLMVSQTDANVTHMSALIQAGSSSAAGVAGANFATLSKAVHDGMASGVVSVTQGARLIGEALNAELKAFGQAPIPLAGLSAGSLAAWQNWWASGAAGTGSGIGHRAGGGWIGDPGQRGADNIPIVVGAGEAVLNYHQQAPVEAALQHTFGMGLGDLFSNVTRPHYMATGGFAGGKGSPGVGTGGTGAMGRMVAMANEINARHYPYLWGGGHNSSFSGPYDCSGAVSAVLHAGGLLGSPEVSGQMMTLGQPGPGRVSVYANPTHVYMSLDGRFFGTSGANPGGGAGWFAGAPRPGFVVRHFDPSGKAGLASGAGGAGQVTAPRVRGTGTVPTIVRGALANAARAANALLARTGAAGGAGGGGNLNENLRNQTLGRSMMMAAGWGAAEWPALRALWSQESGWDAWAVNSSSGAYGIPQSLGHGHPYALGDARAQIAWGLDYIRGRYGTPDAAEAHEKAFGWYARGGFVGGRGLARAARGRAPTGVRGRRPPPAPKLSGVSVGGMRNLDRVARDVTRELQTATDLSNRYSGLAGSFAVTEAAPKFTNPDGSLNAAGIAKHIADDQMLIGIDKQLLRIYEDLEPEIAEELVDVIGSTSGDQRKIATDEKQIGADRQKISVLRTASLKLSAPMPPSRAIANVQAQIRQIRIAFDQRVANVRGKNLTANRAALRRQEAQQISALDGVIASERARAAAHRFGVASQKHRIALQINALTGRDTHLAADVTSLRGILSGSGGGGSQNQALNTLENAAASFGTVLWGPGGRFAGIDQRDQGVIFTTKNDLQALGQDITRTTTAAAAPNLTTLNQLLTTQLQSTQQALAVSQAQFAVFSGLTPQLLGSYATGIARVPQTGPYLLHRDETVIPDQGGPFGNRAATVHTQQGPVEITIVMGNDEQPLMKIIRAEINGRALQVVSDHSGQRARLMAGVRRF